MANVLKMAYQEQLQALIKLGWSNRRVSRETGLSRNTVSRYRQRFQNEPQVPTDVVTCQAQTDPHVPTDSVSPLPDTKSPDIEPLRAVIKEMFTAGLSGQRIYQDLVEDGYAGGYDAVKRYVRKLRRTVAPYPF